MITTTTLAVTTVLPKGWTLEHDIDDGFYTVYSPGHRHGGSIQCALESGSIIGKDCDIEIPPIVLRALECHGRALECRPVALRDVAPGDYLLRSPLAATIYQRGAYDMSAGKFLCMDEADCNRAIWLDGDAIVYIDFNY
jgi:hypothetical protein